MSERSRSAVVIGVLVVSFLLAATAAAIVLTQHLRDEGPVASSIHWKTRPGPRYRACFRLRHDDKVRVSVVDYADRPVRVLSDVELQGGDTPHCFDWDGRTSSGQPVAPGRYHLQLSLERADRTAVSGERLTIHGPGAQS
ncbi:MAG: FlgD immunoglobulin-like domain containing protein [Solirubrobacterales bacterium]